MVNSKSSFLILSLCSERQTHLAAPANTERDHHPVMLEVALCDCTSSSLSTALSIRELYGNGVSPDVFMKIRKACQFKGHETNV